MYSRFTLEILNETGSEQTLRAFFFIIMKIIFDYNRTIFDPEKQELYPGVFDLINELVISHELFLVSKDEPGRKDVLSSLGIDKHFKKIVFTKDKSVSLFQQIVDDAKNVLVVGDRVQGEISVGNQLNYETVWVRQGIFGNQEPESEIQIPNHVINNIAELARVIKLYE